MTYSSDFFCDVWFLLLLNYCLVVLWYLISHLEFFPFFLVTCRSSYRSLGTILLMKLFGAITTHRHFSHIVFGLYWYCNLMNRNWYRTLPRIRNYLFSHPAAWSSFTFIPTSLEISAPALHKNHSWNKNAWKSRKKSSFVCHQRALFILVLHFEQVPLIRAIKVKIGKFFHDSMKLYI